jgi:glycosyltransferase involved in cell wall biosynthesis
MAYSHFYNQSSLNASELDDLRTALLGSNEADAYIAWSRIQAIPSDVLVLELAIDYVTNKLSNTLVQFEYGAVSTLLHSDFCMDYLTRRLIGFRRGEHSGRVVLQLSAAARLKLLRISSWMEDIETVNYLCSILPSDGAEFEREIANVLGVDDEQTWWFRYSALFDSLDCLAASVLPWAKATFAERNVSMYLAIKQYAYSFYFREGVWPCIAEFVAWRRSGEKVSRVPNCEAPRHGNESRALAAYPQFLMGAEWLALTDVDTLDVPLDEGRHLDGILNELSSRSPISATVTNLAYPMGGGESFMKQSAFLCQLLGIRVHWHSLQDAKAGAHRRRRLTWTPYFRNIFWTGDLTVEVVEQMLAQRQYDFVNAQGIANQVVVEACARAGIPAICGFHFWDGLVQLPRTGNRQILANSRELKKFDETIYRRADDLVQRYVVSEFMVDVYKAAGGLERLDIVYPVSDPSHYAVELVPLADRAHVVQLNIAEGKGGRIFAALARRLPDIDFLAVSSEPGSDEIAEEAMQAPNCRVTKYTSVKAVLDDARIVLVPSLVDETFCRVALEAAALGIPVISSRNGYLPYMFGDAGVYVDDNVEAWVATLEALYADLRQLARIGERQRQAVQRYLETYPRQFLELCRRAIDRSPRFNVAMFGPWADQGLGVQMRQYSRDLRARGYKVHIFSFQPYPAEGRQLVWQRDRDEWRTPDTADSVYYSFNNREAVSRYELLQFLIVNRISTLLVPEICWSANWERLLSLPSSINVVSIPNSETILSAEIANHKKLALNLCPTRLCERALRQNGVQNCVYVGYGYGEATSAQDVSAKADDALNSPRLKFLHVAGHNPISRKQTRKVIEAFLRARATRPDIELYVTISDAGSNEFRPASRENLGLFVRVGSLHHDEIGNLYRASHVSIQVSSHEGIGIGFYESIAHGVPVISLDAEPHREAVRDGVSGWLLPATPKPLPDNADPVVCGWEFEAADLAHLLETLTREDVARMVYTTAALHEQGFTSARVADRFAAAITSLDEKPLQVARTRFVSAHFEANDVRIQFRDGMRSRDAITLYDVHSEHRRHRLWGPYVTLHPGHYRATIEIEKGSAAGEDFVLEVSGHSGKQILGSLEGKQVGADWTEWTIPFKCDEWTDGVEVRIDAHEPMRALIKRILISGYILSS